MAKLEVQLSCEVCKKKTTHKYIGFGTTFDKFKIYLYKCANCENVQQSYIQFGQTAKERIAENKERDIFLGSEGI